MRGMTGIELAADSCALVRVRKGRGVLKILAAHLVPPAEWSGDPRALAELLRRVRSEERLPRRARVVVWSLPEGTAVGHPAADAMLAPIVAAGFHVEALVSPAEALAQLAANRANSPSDTAAAWLALNRRHAAIAIVSAGDLIYSRAFDWTHTATSRPHQQLLQRYSLVAHLASELGYGMQRVRALRALRVDSVVTCGDLPDLRSLTMPLTEELDIEVETLDSLEGLVPVGSGTRERVEEWAPALRLACAAATIPLRKVAGTFPAKVPATFWGRRRVAPLVPAAAAVAAVVAAAGWWAYSPQPALPTATAPARAPESPARAMISAPPPKRPPGAPADARASGLATPQSHPPQKVAGPFPGKVPPTFSGAGHSGGASPARGPVAAPPLGDPIAPGAAPATQWAPRPGLTASRSQAQSARATRREDPDPDANLSAAVQLPPRPPRPDPPQRAAGVSPERGPAPLKAALPSVNTILVSSDRRLAVLDGKIVTEGDPVGPRVLVRIEPDAVFLREPSGLEIRVPIRGRPGSEPSPR